MKFKVATGKETSFFFREPDGSLKDETREWELDAWIQGVSFNVDRMAKTVRGSIVFLTAKLTKDNLTQVLSRMWNGLPIDIKVSSTDESGEVLVNYVLSGVRMEQAGAGHCIDDGSFEMQVTYKADSMEIL